MPYTAPFSVTVVNTSNELGWLETNIPPLGKYIATNAGV